MLSFSMEWNVLDLLLLVSLWSQQRHGNLPEFLTWDDMESIDQGGKTQHLNDIQSSTQELEYPAMRFTLFAIKRGYHPQKLSKNRQTRLSGRSSTQAKYTADPEPSVSWETQV